jgi:hypothetical protein
VPIEAIGELPSGAPDLAAQAEARELRRQLHAAIDALPEADRQLVLLFYLAGYRQAEIGAALELPAALVKKRLFRARQRLRTQLDGRVREWLQEQQPDGSVFARLVQFFIAVRLGDLSKVGALLDNDPTLLNAHERWDAATARQHGLPLVSQFTALHRATFNGDSALVELLLDRHADTETQTPAGQTPLHIAVSVDQPAIVAQLLAGGADPNSMAKHRLTPLHFAVIRDRRKIAKQLLDAGADPDAPDWHGRTPLDWAQLKRNENLVLLLTRRMHQKGGSQ